MRGTAASGAGSVVLVVVSLFLSMAMFDPVSGQSATWPENLRVHPAFRLVVQLMAERSPTFRRQLVRLAGCPSVIVTMHPYRDGRLGDIAARTLFGRAGAELRDANVLVTLDNPATVPELVAHEIEHVIEQLDGVDLRRLAEAGASGVRGGPHGALFTRYFETERARQIGRRVASEVGPVPAWVVFSR